MNARELALDLARLKPARRQQLLAELPEERRDELSRLIDELQSMVGAHVRPGFSAFEQILTQMGGSAPADSNPLRDEGVLAHVLQHESLAVKRQVMDVFHGGQVLLTERVRGLVGEWLEQRLQATPYTPAQPAPKNTWWSRLRKG